MNREDQSQPFSPEIRSAAPPKPGHKAKLPITDKIAALREELARAEAEQREIQKAQATIVGKVVIEVMHENAEFARQVAALLRNKVTGARDKATIASLLI